MFSQCCVRPTLRWHIQEAAGHQHVECSRVKTYSWHTGTTNAAFVRPQHRYKGRPHVSSNASAVEVLPNVPSAHVTEPHTEPAPVQSMDWFLQWYPVAFVSDTDMSKPNHFQLMGIPMVIWWEPNAQAWRVFKDVCPHRLVPLSEGRVNGNGQLECGYHGWGFSGSGKCEVIPQQGNAQTPRACATAYPCAVRQGLLFVKPSPLPLAILRHSHHGKTSGPRPGSVLELAELLDESTIPIVPELEEPGWVPQDVWRDLPYDWSTLVENVLDSSHVPFTHHKSMSNRKTIGAYDIKLEAGGVQPGGFQGSWSTGPRGGKLGPQNTVFVAPTFMKNRIDGLSGVDSLTVVYATPSAPGRCRVLNRNVVRLIREGDGGLLAALLRSLPRWGAHIGGQTLLEDDQVRNVRPEQACVLQGQRPAALGKTKPNSYTACKAFEGGFRFMTDPPRVKSTFCCIGNFTLEGHRTGGVPRPLLILRLHLVGLSRVDLVPRRKVFLHNAEPDIARRHMGGTSLAKHYYMASTADTYVAAIHNWIDRYGGGGPFGPPDDAYIAALGPRLSLDQLMDRYSQHTASCSQCQKALKGVRRVRAIATALAFSTAAAAMYAAAVAVATSTMVSPAISAALLAEAGSSVAVAGSPGILGQVGSALLAVGTALAGPLGDPVGQMLRAAAWAGLALACAAVATGSAGLEERFIKGTYPPPRNDPSAD